MTELYCNDYDWELFFRISNLVMPAILKDIYRRRRTLGFVFYVLGGKAVDAHTAKPAYSENYIGSPDWDVDLVGDNIQDFITEVVSRISHTIDGVELIVTPASKELPNGEIQHGFQIGIVTASEKCGIIYFFDVFTVHEIDFKIEVIDGIPYIPSKNLTTHLFELLKQRQDLYRGGLAMRPIETDIALMRIEENIKDQRNRLDRYLSKKIGVVVKYDEIKEKLNEIVDDLVVQEKEYQRIVDLANSIEKVEFDVKLNKQKLKVERTEQRLRRMIKMNRGRFCGMCEGVDVIRVNGTELNCNTVRRYCE